LVNSKLMWKQRRRGSRDRRTTAGLHNEGRQPPQQAVGTGAQAKANQEHNAKVFRYPATGFVTPLEYTLLYAMVAYPTIYPEAVLLETIRDQDFADYLVVNAPPRRLDTEEENANITSYAQLSALLYLAAENWPSPGDFGEDKDAQPSVPQTLCRAILQTVVRHAEEQDLDRKAEVEELLQPLRRLSEQKVDKGNISLLLPMYIGLGLSMATANPIPIWIGYFAGGVLSTAKAPTANEQRNMKNLTSAATRMADVEKASLLDDSEHS
jgi:hypothetical protein